MKDSFDIEDKSLWRLANQKIICKTISELNFEELIEIQTPSLSSNSSKKATLDINNRQWGFNYRMSIWGMVMPTIGTVSVDGNKNPTISEFIVDLKNLVDISEINVAGFMEEINQTLYSEMKHLEKLSTISAKSLIELDETSRQQFLDAHPKLVANKGRLGWGTNELDQFSPEAAAPIALTYLAIKKHCCLSGYEQGLDQKTLIQSLVSKQTFESFERKLPNDWEAQFHIFAVHPWQLDRFIRIQYTEWFIEGNIIELGCDQANWVAQQSIRTLSNKSTSVFYDTKTAITILNTSCYRGIPGKYIEQGAKISNWLEGTVSSDSTLKTLGLHVQKEVAGVFCPHPYQSQVGGSYRYNEMLGCIWRQSAQSILKPGQRPLSMSTLMQGDAEGNSCIGALIEASSVTPREWLQRMFHHVVTPLYHLMCQYGVALVAHGQNITLILQDNLPVGCIIKDFHGDLRLVDQDYSELETLDTAIKSNLGRLPSEYLVHDLLTGHFVTVLRFISPWMEQEGISEQEFYGMLGKEILDYQEQHPQLKERFKQFDLLKPEIEKICLNRVRFRLGLNDTNERPVPELGTPIKNPLVIGLSFL
ncbi:IucA/IucC family protein [Vibrio sp. SCSIO 43136]|uniref:IucA/IucC family protein n=1 Tax=Vibrio sp. SCSIO 43136 TaxID=2819101 RepID=UPI002075C424|nr:IucA/IucC family protein [Vibrio sp. SCSIO 43136]USD67616.1 IucA/IucC family protein [Vibrio sp. SCSIO 43136]